MFFDTLKITCGVAAKDILERAAQRQINLRVYSEGVVGVTSLLCKMEELESMCSVIFVCLFLIISNHEILVSVPSWVFLWMRRCQREIWTTCSGSLAVNLQL